jgi:O-acetylhomoserine (thiol)-lyase
VTDTGLFDWTRFANIAQPYRAQKPALWGITQIRKKGLRDGGATLAAAEAHRISVGAETLALRMDRQCANAQALAEYLARHPSVAAVHYPGLPSHPQQERAAALFRAPGALFSFELAPGHDVLECLDRLRIVVLSSNLGDNRTLAIPVAQTIFWELGAARRAQMGIADSLIRVSVGIEDRDDLIDDFRQALR